MSIEITEYRNARATTENASSIDVEINHPQYGWIPYLLTDYDDDNTINNDDLRALIGNDYAPYVPPTQDELEAEQADMKRYYRDYMLKQFVDPVVQNPLRWDDLGDDRQQQVVEYRKALLDITIQSGWPWVVQWPEKPEFLEGTQITEQDLLEE